MMEWLQCHSGFQSLTRMLVVVSSIILYAIAAVPTFSGFPSQGYIARPENIPINSVLFSATVTDSDRGDLITISMDSLTEHFVKLSQKTGTNSFGFNIILKSTLDKESQEFPSPIHLKFRATDIAGNETVAICDLYIFDINDNKPEFQNLPYNWDLPELPFNGTVFYQIYATDKDTGSDSTTGKGYGYVTYTMEPIAQSPRRRNLYMDTFKLDPNTGHVTLKQPVNYEQNIFYQFSIKAEDGGGLVSTSYLTIRVLDVQDQPPFFTGKPYRTSIREDMSIGTSVIHVEAEDGDWGVPNNVTYDIDGPCSSLFTISSEGTISTAYQLDRDSLIIKNTSGTCILVVTATEVNNPAHEQFGANATRTDVLIEVQDINDNPPIFGITSVNAAVPENTPVGVPITLNRTITVSDIDQGANADIFLHLEWMNGHECSDFKAIPEVVHGRGDVEILVQNTTLLDYELTESLSFKLIATNPGNTAYNDTVEVNLRITDVNDHNPEFGHITKEFNIDENSPTGTFVGTISATDEDTTSNETLVYSISGGSDRFLVDKTTGTLTTYCPTNCTQDFDRERYSVFTILYSVTDEDKRSDSVLITVNLNDLNDNNPAFYRHEFRANTAENTLPNSTTPVVRLDASDEDVTAENNVVSYHLLPSPSNVPAHIHENFTLNSTTGELFLKSPVDYEKLPSSIKSEIRMHVQVNDSGYPTRTSTAVVIIVVQDENDNAPVFTQAVYNASVPEDASSNTTNKTYVCNISAHDADGTKANSDLQYFIVSGSYERFAINSRTGVVSVQTNVKLDRETVPLYNITIVAIDQGLPAHTSTTAMFITVIDVNDEPPIFDHNQYDVAIYENCTYGQVVLTVQALDPDTDANLMYSIVGVAARDDHGNTINTPLVKSKVTDYFSIKPDDGTVTVHSTLDRKTAAEVTLTLQVEDKNATINKPQTANASLRITLIDVNKHATDTPSLTQSTTTYTDLTNSITYSLNGGTRPTESPSSINYCSFSSDMCDWILDRASQTQWQRHSGSTPSVQTGPAGDHLGSSSASYIYIEASGHVNEVAILTSTPYQGGEYCLDFYNHMYGSHMGSLYVNAVTPGGSVHRLKSFTGDHGNSWHHYNVHANIQTSDAFKFQFEGHVGGGSRSDIAIDDIAVTTGACPV